MDWDSAEELLNQVTIGELEAVLKWFKKENNPGPYGWSVEFYLALFDLLGQEILEVVEETKSIGRLYDAFKSNFIALIPKSDHPSSFKDFRPISLCNCIYKIMAKIIASRLKPILFEHISPEQFAISGKQTDS